VTLKKALLTLLSALIALMLCDLLAGVLLSRFAAPPPYILQNVSIGKNVELFWKMTSADKRPIVFTGSSMILEGISPHIFDDTVQSLTGQQIISMNVSQTGATTLISRDVIKSLLLPADTPLVIYGIEMRALNPQGADSAFLASPLGYALNLPPGIGKDVQLWLLQHSTLLRYRRNLFDFFTSGNQHQEELASAARIDDRGYIPVFTQLADTQDVSISGTDFLPFQPTDSQITALKDIVAACRPARCLVVNMPIHRSLSSAIPPHDVERYQNLLHTNVVGISLWDFNTPACLAVFTDKSFADDSHLNDKGATKFSEMVAALYAAQFLGVPVSADSPAHCANVF
jgi:hypothetical protein